ncbi:hypothetical protein Tco_1123218 [Tanacetum coccineum]|uniref:Uncharacterized protein n=1 Tax=Tanacetum coccineum TaxID=301880 RepID=A0ABQ5J2Q9_9ASTR
MSSSSSIAPTKCKYGLPLMTLTSWTHENPARRFDVCLNKYREELKNELTSREELVVLQVEFADMEGVWIAEYVKYMLSLHRIHLVMGVLLVVKAFNLICASEAKHLIKFTVYSKEFLCPSWQVGVCYNCSGYPLYTPLKASQEESKYLKGKPNLAATLCILGNPPFDLEAFSDSVMVGDYLIRNNSQWVALFHWTAMSS